MKSGSVHIFVIQYSSPHWKFVFWPTVWRSCLNSGTCAFTHTVFHLTQS